MLQERPVLLKIKNRRRFGLAASNSGGRACPSPNTCCASSILASLVELDKAFRFGDEPGYPKCPVINETSDAVAPGVWRTDPWARTGFP
jgi:hypothetical protein